jgi:hypothetical protein
MQPDKNVFLCHWAAVPDFNTITLPSLDMLPGGGCPTLTVEVSQQVMSPGMMMSESGCSYYCLIPPLPPSPPSHLLTCRPWLPMNQQHASGLTADTRVLCWRRWQIDTDDFAHPVRLKKTGFAPVSYI